MKNSAHNLNEVKALVKEAILNGNIDSVNGVQWFSHQGEFLCRSIATETMFHLEMPNVTVESFKVL